jgi:hypothetical protein
MATEREEDGKGVYETREGVQKGSVNWVKGDFFKEGFGAGVEGKFDFIYDYTVCMRTMGGMDRS